MKGGHTMDMNQIEIAKRVIEIHDIIDFIDDGYHNADIHDLIKISNELFSKLTPTNQNELKRWFDKKNEIEKGL